jgi:putative nucleotidyltransferase with HDIG domain
MLKKIPVAQVRIGMFLHGLEGGWLKHPFWRSRFLIRTRAELAQLQASGVRECWIDPTRGDDVGAVSAPAAPRLPEPPVAVASANVRFIDELALAERVIDRAQHAVRGLLDDARLGRAIDKQHCLPVVEEVTQSIVRHHGALISLLRLKHCDDYSYLHSVAVCALMVALARELHLPPDEVRLAGLAGLVHDIGKAPLPPELLRKPGPLSPDEYALIKTHAEQGHALLAASGLPAEALDVCLHHHERLDGNGYPHGLAEGQISLMARMGAICDVYDAITSNRPYKAAWNPAEAIARMASWRGQFDPAVFSAFVRCLGLYPTGSLVRLNSGRLAVVMEQNPGALSEPVIRVFFCTERRTRISPLRLDLACPQAQDFIVSRESADEWPVGTTDALWGHGYATRAFGAGAELPAQTTSHDGVTG